MDFFILGGFIVNCFGVASQIISTYKDLSSWEEKDLKVNREYLTLAIQKGILSPSESEYAWVNESNVPELELKGTHEMVFALNEAKKIKYRLVYGQNPPNILVKKVSNTI